VISYKENSLFAYFSKNTVATGFKLSSNVYQMIIYNFSIDTMLGKSRFRFDCRQYAKNAISYKENNIFSNLLVSIEFQ
jgi:hypothetical protein